MRAAGLTGASRRRKGVTTTRRDNEARCAPAPVDRDVTAAGPNHLRTELVLDALDMAIGQRRSANVIHHSDLRANEVCREGSPYPSLAFGGRCLEAGGRPSMGSAGDAYDNAMCENFFATLEWELPDRRRFASQAEAKMACFSFTEGWYNPVRLLSALGDSSPMAYDATVEAPNAEP